MERRIGERNFRNPLDRLEQSFVIRCLPVFLGFAIPKSSLPFLGYSPPVISPAIEISEVFDKTERVVSLASFSTLTS